MTIEIGTNGFRDASEEGGGDEKDQHDEAVISPARYEWIYAAAELYVAAEQRGLRLVRADGPRGHFLSEAQVLDNVLLFPPGRHPRDVLRDIGADSDRYHSGGSGADPSPASVPAI